MSRTRVEVRMEGGEALMAALEALKLNVRSELRRATVAGAQIIETIAQALAPGPHIGHAVVSASAEQVVVEIGPKKSHWYYRFFETGARPHEIRGKPLLAFEGGGGLIITPRVNHPGMAAQPFLRPAADSNEDAVQNEMGQALRRRIESVRA